MSDPTEIPTPLAARYGTDRPVRRRVGLVLGGLLATALLVWAVWAGSSQGDEPLQAQVTSYDVVSSHETRVKVATQSEDADVQGSCLLRATAEDHTVVGEVNLTADELRAARGQWIPIRTEREATTATVVRCGD